MLHDFCAFFLKTTLLVSLRCVSLVYCALCTVHCALCGGKCDHFISRTEAPRELGFSLEDSLD